MSTLTKAFGWILTLFTMALVACASAEISDLEYPLGDLKSMTQTFFNNKLNDADDSGREFRSDFFRPNIVRGRIESPRSEDQVRAQAKIRFVGNERPYSILTWVEIETKEGGKWVSQGVDNSLSKRVSDQLNEFIKARRDKNVIDHFRPF